MPKTAQYKVMMLSVIFSYEVERAATEIGKIVRAAQRWCRPAMFGKRAVGFVILTEEMSVDLVKRLRPTLDGITCVHDYRCHTMLEDIVGKHGSFDPLVGLVKEAWAELRKRNDPKYVRQGEGAETIIVGNMENFDRRTAIQMGIKGRGSRKPTQNPDR